jgi:hypothetical protein
MGPSFGLASLACRVFDGNSESKCSPTSSPAEAKTAGLGKREETTIPALEAC